MNFHSFNLPLGFDNALSLEGALHSLIEDLKKLDDKFNTLNYDYENYTNEKIKDTVTEINKSMEKVKTDILQLSNTNLNQKTNDLILRIQSNYNTLNEKINNLKTYTDNNIIMNRTLVTNYINEVKKDLEKLIAQGGYQIASIFDGTKTSIENAVHDYNKILTLKNGIADYFVYKTQNSLDSNYVCSDRLTLAFLNTLKNVTFRSYTYRRNIFKNQFNIDNNRLAYILSMLCYKKTDDIEKIYKLHTDNKTEILDNTVVQKILATQLSETTISVTYNNIVFNLGFYWQRNTKLNMIINEYVTELGINKTQFMYWNFINSYELKNFINLGNL